MIFIRGNPTLLHPGKGDAFRETLFIRYPVYSVHRGRKYLTFVA